MSTTPAQPDTGFADLPKGPASGAGGIDDLHVQRLGDQPYTEFTLTKALVGKGFGPLGFTDTDLVFGISEITPDQESRAGKLAGAGLDFAASYVEQQKMTLYMIGGKKTDNQFDLISKWFKAIGPRGRKVVEMCYSEVNSIEQVDGSQIASSGRYKSG